jgi:hypothetical protein
MSNTEKDSLCSVRYETVKVFSLKTKIVYSVGWGKLANPKNQTDMYLVLLDFVPQSNLQQILSQSLCARNCMKTVYN